MTADSRGKKPSYQRAGCTVAADYRDSLLSSLGLCAANDRTECEADSTIEWAASGAMTLTGMAEGPPLPAPGHLAACARGAADALRLLAGQRWSATMLDAPALLAERAALLGLSRHGAIAPGGSCRLLQAADGWIALNLARPEDFDLLPAWLTEEVLGEPWAFIADRVVSGRAAEIVTRARMLGLAAAEAKRPTAEAPPWFRIGARGRRLERNPNDVPLVVDLSSLWAGPLCTGLLALAGAEVIKVESRQRPDGARRGSSEFYDLLNVGKQSVAFDFGKEKDRRRLARLIEQTDIVVESTRPRALAQLGIDAVSLVERIPGLTWLSITAYGRSGAGANWIGFGDDTAVAAGLAIATAEYSGLDTPLFCGDAIADPLTGLHAALAALASWQRGGGRRLDLALRDVVAHVMAFGPPAGPSTVRASSDPRFGAWEVVSGGRRQAVLPPRSRTLTQSARILGEDTASVVRDRGLAC